MGLARGTALTEMHTLDRSTRLSLLVVDDDSELCGMMKEFFEQIGHSVDVAYNGRDGLARALRHAYDLIVLDLRLPGKGGLDFLRELRARGNGIGVLVLTARGDVLARVDRHFMAADRIG